MKTVLLVDDDATMRSLLKTLLEIEGFAVIAKDITGEQILESMRQTNPDVVLMDIHLKDANGLDILHKVRQDPDLLNLRVVMTSGKALREECLAAGANGFLLKPYMPAELIAMIRQQAS